MSILPLYRGSIRVKEKIINRFSGKELKKIYYALLDFFFPSFCRICSGSLDGAKWVCKNCLDKIQELPSPYCSVCGFPLPPSFIESEVPLCKDCNQKPRYFTKARSVSAYDGVMKECIHLLKYEGKAAVSKPLGILLAKLIEKHHLEGELLLPVPLHPKKKRERGFNQAELLCKEIESYLGIPMDKDILIKKRPTSSQTGLNKKERIVNVKDSFSIKRKKSLIDKKVILVDDVFTTGATVDECSKVLLAGGAKAVYVVTLARKV